MVRQKERKKPIQLNRNATGKRRRWLDLTHRGNEDEASGFRKLTEKGQHEDAFVPYPQLVGVFKVVSGHKVFVLGQTQRQEEKSEDCRQSGSFEHGNTEELLSRASQTPVPPLSNQICSPVRTRREI